MCVECDVWIYNKNMKRVLLVGSGVQSVSHFWNLAKDGIPGVKEAKFSFNMNVDVRIDGKDLVAFLAGEYPKINADVIIPEEEYVISCYDMS